MSAKEEVVTVVPLASMRQILAPSESQWDEIKFDVGPLTCVMMKQAMQV